METTTKYIIRTLTTLLEAKGIKEAVLAPGSRNAPLSIAFNRQKGIRCHIIVDERCAGYVALGMAQKSNQAVAVVCTSGTALLNLAPAVAEAYYQQIPLIVISADRPAEWIDQDDSQTIRQDGILNNIVKHSYQLPEEDREEKNRWLTNRMINEAINLSISGQHGPIHINVPIDEPLYETTESTENERVINCITQTGLRMTTLDIKKLTNDTHQAKILLLAGFMAPNKTINTIINEWADTDKLCVLAENLSNLYGKNICNNVENVFASITEDEIEKFRPDLLIIIGGALVSKSAKKFLRCHPAKNTWKIGEETLAVDTMKHLTWHFQCSPDTFATQMQKTFTTSDTQNIYNNTIKKRSIDADNKRQNQCNKNDWNENQIFATIYNALPKGSDLHLSNGTSVRNGLNIPNSKELKYFANRGTSGIDGCTSTAIGSALMNQNGITTLITGDLCMLYDSNALWNDEMPQNLKIIIINNHGGGIFGKMPGPPTTTEFNRFFLTPEHINFSHLASAFNIDFLKANKYEDLTDALNLLYKNNGCKILEIEI